jgi:hypothetical protein
VCGQPARWNVMCEDSLQVSVTLDWHRLRVHDSLFYPIQNLTVFLRGRIIGNEVWIVCNTLVNKVT